MCIYSIKLNVNQLHELLQFLNFFFFTNVSVLMCFLLFFVFKQNDTMVTFNCKIILRPMYLNNLTSFINKSNPSTFYIVCFNIFVLCNVYTGIRRL